MGAAVSNAVSADPELSLVAAVDPAHAGEPADGGLTIASGPDVMEEARVEVAVDFTVAKAALANARWCAERGVHAVVGTTGLGEAGLAELAALFAPGPANCVVAPNFAIGAVLMMRFAELAAPWFESVEVVELHHDAKLDAPSGTALLLAERISRRRRGAGATAPAAGASDVPARGVEAAAGVRVHSVRLRGLVAHHEVIFGTAGQSLTVRHDSLDRSSFMAGVLLAVKQVPTRRGLTVGLDPLLGL